MEENIFGYVPSVIDGSERIFGEGVPMEIPDSYTYRSYMAPIINQGELSICVPCTMSAYLNWRENLKDGTRKDNGVALMDIYRSKTNQGDGMSFKAAFHYLRHHGVKSRNGNLMINAYAMIKNPEFLKHAIVMNGPCFGALPVYNSDYDFWNEKIGDRLNGYHAISIIGYDEEGFFIRNSWGTEFGDEGYTHIKNEDLSKLIEIWTVID